MSHLAARRTASNQDRSVLLSALLMVETTANATAVGSASLTLPDVIRPSRGAGLG